MKQFAFMVVVLAVPAGAFAQPTLDTLRNIHPRPGTALSSLWGYTGPDGREYALVGIAGSGSGSTSGGTSIVDITVDANPRVVTHIGGPNNTWREMKTYRQYAYVVTDAPSGTGVQIIDLSRLPDTASLATTFSYSNGPKNINRSFSITMSDGYMYLNGCANWAPGGMLIFDLRNDPLNPQFVGEYQPMYIHDSYVLRDTIYASAIQAGGGLIIADARNKGGIHMIGRIAYANSGTHNGMVSKDRRFVFTTDERSHPQLNVKVWDIGNLPTIPTVPSATFTVNPASTVHNVHIRGDYAYCSWYQGYGLQIADVSNPASPVLAAGYSTSAASLAWEVYPYFPSGKIIVGDMQTGLWIFRFSELAARLPVHLLEPLSSDTVRSTASMVFRWTRTADINEDPHWYEVQLKGAGVDTSWKVMDTVSLFSAVALLQNEQTYGWKVTARDEWNATASVDSFTFVYNGSTGVIVSVDVNAGWNAVSLPVRVNDPRVTSAFPTSTSSAFSYNGTYLDEDSLDPGKGYWIKFADNETISLFGAPVPGDTVNLVPGWNLIGSISSSVPISAIVQTPPTLLLTPFFVYSPAGYHSASIISPGRAYWVKAGTWGYIIIGD